jgi:hypothetical protein
MKNSLILKVISFFSTLFYCYGSIAGETLRVSIPKMPVHAVSEEEGVLVDLVKVLSKKLEQKIDIQLVPFSRSIYYVITNKVDFHLPFIKPNLNFSSSKAIANKNSQAVSDSEKQQHNFIYSNETIFHVNFVLYTHKDTHVDVKELATYNIETDSAHLPFFPELTMGSDCILCSLKKVQYQMTDGYIFADSSTDPLLKENKQLLASVKRQLFQRFEVKIVFPNTNKGQELNKKMSIVIAKMRLSGELAELLSSVDFPYDGWQL